MGTLLALKISVRCRHGRLDRQLAAGRDAAGDPALSLRALQLCNPTTRERLADTLAGLVGMAFERPLPSESPRLDRDAIIDTRLLLLDLAGRLRADAVVSPRAVALVSTLLEDHDGPLYLGDSPGRSLGSEARAAIAALDL